MMKTQIGLGVLSIPVAFNALGIVPGVICLCVIGGITTWSDYIIGVFKLRHREVYGIDDVGELLFGRPGKIVLGAAFLLCECRLHADRFSDVADHSRVDVCRRFRHAGHLDLAERCFVPCDLHCGFCSSCHGCHIRSVEYTDSGTDLLVSLGWSDLYPDI